MEVNRIRLPQNHHTIRFPLLRPRRKREFVNFIRHALASNPLPRSIVKLL